MTASGDEPGLAVDHGGGVAGAGLKLRGGCGQAAGEGGINQCRLVENPSEGAWALTTCLSSYHKR